LYLYKYILRKQVFLFFTFFLKNIFVPNDVDLYTQKEWDGLSQKAQRNIERKREMTNSSSLIGQLQILKKSSNGIRRLSEIRKDLFLSLGDLYTLVINKGSLQKTPNFRLLESGEAEGLIRALPARSLQPEEVPIPKRVQSLRPARVPTGAPTGTPAEAPQSKLAQPPVVREDLTSRLTVDTSTKELAQSPLPESRSEAPAEVPAQNRKKLSPYDTLGIIPNLKRLNRIISKFFHRRDELKRGEDPNKDEKIKKINANLNRFYNIRNFIMRRRALNFVSHCFSLRLEGQDNYSSLIRYVERYCKSFRVETTREGEKLPVMEMIKGVVVEMRNAGTINSAKLRMEEGGAQISESIDPLSRNIFDLNGALEEVEREVLGMINVITNNRGTHSEIHEASRKMSKLMNSGEDSELEDMIEELDDLMEAIEAIENSLMPYFLSKSSKDRRK
jgi:hypothetical protein